MALKRALMFILVVLTATLLVSEAFAGGYSVMGIGARARSMAGAFRAVADDWSAMYYNPAGLARMEQSQFNTTVDFNGFRPTYDPNVTLDGYSFGYPTGERYPDDIVINFPNFSLVSVAPFGFPVTAGIAFFEPYDENLRWDLYRFAEGYGEPDANLPNIDYQYNLDILDFHPTIATSFADDRLHAGIGLSIRKGNLLTNQIFLLPGNFGAFPVFRPYDRLVKWGVVDVSGFGFGANVGILYEISDKFSFGATYQSKTTISMDGDVITRFYSPNNDAIQTGQDREVDTMFSGFAFEATHHADVDMTLPTEYGFGFAYQASEYVKLAADVMFTRWSEFKDVTVKLRDSRGPLGIERWPIISSILMTDIVYPYSWDDVMRISVGVEGQASDVITLRGGYSYDQSPVPDDVASPLVTDTGDRHHLAGGFSAFYRNLEFAVTGGIAIMPHRDVNKLTDLNEDGIWDNLTGKYGNSSFNTSFSMTVKF